MSDDPFGDLDAAMGGGTDDVDESERETGAEPETHGERRESDEPASEPDAEPEDPRKRPAFEFDQTTHKALYVLETVASEFDDVITYDVERELTREYGLRNVTKSELHNAALAAAAKHPEFIVQQMLDQRGVDWSEDES